MEIEEPSNPKKPRVSLSDRMEVINLKKNKETDIKVSQSLDLSFSTVNYIWNTYQKTGMVEDIKQSDRPREVSIKQENKANRNISGSSWV